MNFIKEWFYKKACSIAFGRESPFDPQEYMQSITAQPAFMLPMQKKIKAAQNVKFGVVKKEKAGKKDLPEHTLAPLFEMVNPTTSFNHFLDYLMIWLEGEDNGVLIEVVEGLKGMAPDLNLYNPRNFTIYFEGNSISKIEIHNPARTITGENEIKKFAWIRNPNYDNVMAGRSGTTYATGYSKHNAFAILGAYSKKAWEWNWSLAKHLGKIGGILSTERALTKDDRKELREKFTADNGGANNVGQPLVVGSGLKYQDTSKAPIDSDWNLGEQKSWERAAIACDVPAELVGGGDSTYQNRKHAKKELYQEGVIPFLNNLCSYLNYLLKPFLSKGEYIDYSLVGIDALKDDIGEIIKNLAPIKDRVTVNEYRDILNKFTDLNLENLGEKGNVIILDAGIMTLDELLEVDKREDEKEEDLE
ncbi:phage portal protein [Fusobacterium sp. THCT1E2]